MKIIGPFKQLVTLANLPLRGKLSDDELEIIVEGGILIKDGKVEKTASFQKLKEEFPTVEVEEIQGEQVCLPAFVDSHTHICFGGNGANDFAMRNAGKTYLEIAETGGGIWSLTAAKHWRCRKVRKPQRRHCSTLSGWTE